MFGKIILLRLALSLILEATAMASALLSIDTATVIATTEEDIIIRDSGVCDPGHGQPGGFMWCRQEDWHDCYYEPPSGTCWSFDSGFNIPHSLGPDAGGYCEFYSGSMCLPPVVSVIAPNEPGKVSNHMVCPGTNNLPNAEGFSMKCKSSDPNAPYATSQLLYNYLKTRIMHIKTTNTISTHVANAIAPAMSKTDISVVYQGLGCPGTNLLRLSVGNGIITE